MTERDQVDPDGKWTFDERVAACFPDMLSRSVPLYDEMRRAVYELGRRYLYDGEILLDLGASTGGSIEYFVEEFGSRIQYEAVEASEPMRKAFSARYPDLLKYGAARLFAGDLRVALVQLDAGSVGLGLSILTLQFVPIEYRQRVVEDVYRALRPGGAFILVEKVLGADAAIDNEYVRAYHRYKERNGYSKEAIAKKASSLEGVLVPLTAAWNEELLRSAGFRRLDCFWRWLNFAGWIAIKEG